MVVKKVDDENGCGEWARIGREREKEKGELIRVAAILRF